MTVKTPAGTSNALPFTYQAPAPTAPTITALTCSTAELGAGTTSVSFSGTSSPAGTAKTGSVITTPTGSTSTTSSTFTVNTDGSFSGTASGLQPGSNSLSVVVSDGAGNASGASSCTVNVARDTTPDTFSFTAVTNATRSTAYMSDAITVSGIDSPSPVSVSVGTLLVNNAVVTSSNPTVNNGDTVQVSLTSSASYNTAVSSTVTIGGVSSTYSVTTAQDATKPALSVTCPAATQAVGTASVSFVNGTANDDSGSVTVTLSRNGAAASTLTSAPGSFVIPDQVLDVGDNSFLFTASDGVNTTSVTCEVYRTPDTTPDPFVLTAQTGADRSTEYTSNTVTVSGLEVSVPVSATAGKLFVNGTEVTSSNPTVKNGDTVQVKLIPARATTRPSRAS